MDSADITDELRAQLEGVSDHIRLWFDTSLVGHDDPQLVMRPIVAALGLRCTSVHGVDIAGREQTGDDGQLAWSLTQHWCEGDVEFGDIVSFVATPHANSPVSVTVTVSRPSPPNDVQVNIFTWDANGRPAPRVPIYYRCRASYEQIIG